MNITARPRWRIPTIGVCLLAAIACSSVPIEVMYGKTNCYMFTGAGVSVGQSTFSASGIRARAEMGCPKIKKVTVVIFDDTNGNGVRDPGEPVFGQTSGQANPASSEVVTGSVSCGKNTDAGGTTWQADVENENGDHTTHGGTF
jgi:hypothetical protein